MMPFITRRTHDAEMAKKDVLIDSLDKTAKKLRQQRDMYMSQYQEAIRDGDRQRSEKMRVAAERDTLQSRLYALTPARREDGRFTAKARRLQPASPPASIAGHGLEDFA